MSSSTSDHAKNLVGSVGAKAQEVLKEDYEKTRDVVTSAAKSGSYLYPFKGIYYFLSHRALWKPLLKRLLPELGLSAGVVIGMFLFTYIPQLAIMVFVNGPLAVLSTVLLVLSESSTIISIVSRQVFLHEAQLDTFDGTLVAKGATEIVTEGRELKSGGDPIQRLGKIIKSPFAKYSPKAIIRYFMYLPLNFIPLVGTALFIFFQGRARGQSIHSRYFQLKKWSGAQQNAWLRQHAGPYTAFGTVATLLEMVPIANIFFGFTNTVGAALWAADIEAKGTEMTRTTAPELREAAKKAE